MKTLLAVFVLAFLHYSTGCIKKGPVNLNLGEIHIDINGHGSDGGAVPQGKGGEDYSAGAGGRSEDCDKVDIICQGTKK